MGAESSRPAITRIGVLGAGTMGAGIAQVAAEGGFDTIMHDPIPGASERGLARIRGFLERKVEKGQLAADKRDAALAHIHTTGAIRDLGEAGLVVEAIPEEIGLKREAFRLLDEAAGPATILASNTSSLSIARIASATAHPERVAGLHFFNPVPLMALVEVVRGPLTQAAVADSLSEVARRLGKTPVVALDSPGFIVNRVARPFYLEALRIVGEGTAGVVEVDGAVREMGFRMGPFELIDTIGVDVNFAVSRSVFEQFFFEPRYRPHPIQAMILAAGRTGRKAGAGFYDWGADGSRGSAWAVLDRRSGGPRPERLSSGQIGARILATLVNEAASAVADGVATPESIDRAMRLGTNYPSGPLEWGERIGLSHVVHTLDALHAAVPDGRYRVVPLLRSLAERNASFYA